MRLRQYSLPLLCLLLTGCTAASGRKEKECLPPATAHVHTLPHDASYAVKKLHPNSHLYTSETPVADFPGRKFRIVGQCSFNKKEIKKNLSGLKKANITVRNFPSTVAELRKRINLAEGGDTYLFATTLSDGQEALIRCKKATL